MPKTQEDSNAVNQYWWIFLIQGIAAVLIGWLLLSSPVITVISLILFLGLYWLVVGIVDIIFSIIEATKGGANWGWKLAGGIIGVLAGLFVLNNQAFSVVFTPVVFMYVIAFTFIINGIVTMAVGSRSENEEDKYHWSWANFFLGLFYLLFGFILLTSPTIVAISSLVFASGILAVAGGIMLIILAFRVRSDSKNEKK